MNIRLVLAILLILLLLGSLPGWHGYGYAPASLFTVLLIVLLVLVVTDRI